MAIILNGDTGISSIGALSGVTSVSSAAADTPVILQDSSSNSNTCRAWVNFNGTGTVAIRADFNVSSITDNGTGDYTVNFTTAMPDANYAPVVSTSPSYGLQWGYSPSLNTTTSSATEVAPTTTALRVFQYSPSGAYDPKYFSVAIFR